MDRVSEAVLPRLRAAAAALGSVRQIDHAVYDMRGNRWPPAMGRALDAAERGLLRATGSKIAPRPRLDRVYDCVDGDPPSRVPARSVWIAYPVATAQDAVARAIVRYGPAGGWWPDHVRPYLPQDHAPAPPWAPRDPEGGYADAVRALRLVGAVIRLVSVPHSTVADLVSALRSIWTSGRRHNLALILGSILAASGVSQVTAEEIVAGVSDSVGGNTRGRVADVRDSYRRHEDGRRIAGWPTLRQLIPEPGVVDLIDSLLYDL